MMGAGAGAGAAWEARAVAAAAGSWATWEETQAEVEAAESAARGAGAGVGMGVGAVEAASRRSAQPEFLHTYTRSATPARAPRIPAANHHHDDDDAYPHTDSHTEEASLRRPHMHEAGRCRLTPC